MPAKSHRKPQRQPVRTDRDRAVVLLGILAGFLAVFVVLLLTLSNRSWTGLSQLLPSLGIAMIGVGITVLVTTFSFVFVALSLVSVQFSPRVVRHFWHGDRFRSIFLWSFIAIFAFLFVVQFLPHVELHLLAVILAAYAVFVLFPSFLSYLADNLNAASITKNIADRTLDEIDRDLAPLRRTQSTYPSAICSDKIGFLENIDTERLSMVFSRLRANEPMAVLKSVNYFGSFVEVGSPLAVIEPETELGGRTESEIRECFVLHKFRSIDQDIEYGIRQLVDIGVKAISPAVNDPTTCVNCIHYLGVIIKELIGRESRSVKSLKLEKQGILLKEPSFEQYIDDAFDQIYQFGRNDHVIVRAIIGVLTEIISAAPDADRAAIVVKEIGEMELTALYQAGGREMFPLIENRNYVRKALRKFYIAAGEKLDRLGKPEMADRHKATAAAVGESMDV
ncbi:MAG: DUF2254 domain-containing protein [Acidobacteria bacterium]|nr:DUF2254 domain-containing protein [Acidobacteriota bacterium]